jgi:predicted nuclease of predicted toxin-antitoxin system
MKFLVDAQLLVRLARWLRTSGYDTIHTFDLPQQNLTRADCNHKRFGFCGFFFDHW